MRHRVFSLAVTALTATLLFSASQARAVDKETILHTFNSVSDGARPQGSLIFDSAGNLYGTNLAGGAYNWGTVFELSPSGTGWTETVLYTFTGKPDGGAPVGNLVFDAAGNLYGTTVNGGAYDYGTVFELSPVVGGGWTETVLHSFTVGSDGGNPFAGLVFDHAGNLYGTTERGGIEQNCCGTVFKLAPSVAGGWTFTVLWQFTDKTEGGFPQAGVILDASGNLYGVTPYGVGTSACELGCGAVFELSPTPVGFWKLTVLHAFTGGKDGENAMGGLVMDAAGNLYGTTLQGANLTGCPGFGCGTVFKLTPGASGWRLGVLHTFTDGTDGAYPYSGVIFDASGNLYGTTFDGGAFGDGTVFKLTHGAAGGWIEATLHSFHGGADGEFPLAGLVTDPSGNIYGTAEGGKIMGCQNCAGGTVFELSPIAAKTQ